MRSGRSEDRSTATVNWQMSIAPEGFPHRMVKAGEVSRHAVVGGEEISELRSGAPAS
jgi:hypothetical protein